LADPTTYINHLEKIHEIDLHQGHSSNGRFRLFRYGIRSLLLRCRCGLLRWHAALLLVNRRR